MPSIPLPTATKIVPQEKNSATFVIEGLYPGYGVTIGNSLRRILLSSLPGAAVIGVKIRDVDHEFSTIPHVHEDVVTILLNIKKARFKMHESGSFQATLKAHGEKEVKAGDIKVPSELEVINPVSHIATLTDRKAELELTLYIKEGLGYELAEEHANDLGLKDIGILKVDSIFTPVVISSFVVENMRVGQRTDYNRVKLTIETDGTLTPKEAFEKSLALFIQQLQAIQQIDKSALLAKRVDLQKGQLSDEAVPSAPMAGKEIKTTLSGRSSISHLKLTSRIERLILKKKIKTISQLSKKNEEELMKIDGIGEAAVKEIRRKLGKAGFLLSG